VDAVLAGDLMLFGRKTYDSFAGAWPISSVKYWT
jgi:hypothetical protein